MSTIINYALFPFNMGILPLLLPVCALCCKILRHKTLHLQSLTVVTCRLYHDRRQTVIISIIPSGDGINSRRKTNK